MTYSGKEPDQEFEAIGALIRDSYGMAGEVTALPGEHDLNYRIRMADGATFLLKLHAPGAPLDLAIDRKSVV